MSVLSVLIDTDIVIEVLRGRNERVSSRWLFVSDSSEILLVSPITLTEVRAGAFEREQDAIANFFAPLTFVPVDERIGQLAGDYLRRYGKTHGLMIADALIAASAVLSNSALWTRNRKHYPMPEVEIYA
jgi:hypothetical protein